MKWDKILFGGGICFLAAQPSPQANPVAPLPLDDAGPHEQLNLSPETAAALITLINANKVEVLPSGQLIIKALTVADLKNFGIIKETIAKDAGWTPGSIVNDGK